MRANSCERWVHLGNRETSGECLTENEKRFRREHLHRCAACSAETRFWSMLDGVLVNPDFLESPHSSRPPKPKKSLYFWAFSLAAVVGLLVGATTLDHLRRNRRATTARREVTQALHATVLRTQGHVHIAARDALASGSVHAGERISTEEGRTCISVEGRVTTCLADRTEAHFAQPEADVVQVHLHHGHLLSQLEPRARPYVVVTRAGTIEAKGTVFSVRVVSPERTSVVLHEGRLWLKSATGESALLTAPARALIEGNIHVERAEAHATPQPGSPTAGAYAVDEELINLSKHDAAPPTHAAPSAEPMPRTMQSAKSDAQRTQPPSASELLRQAQHARALGQSASAQHLYDQLISTYPQSDEARVSLVSLGEFELSELKHPHLALSYFNRYLAHGGPLTREARYGKIRALSALHRTEEAKGAAASFVADFPTSVQADAIRRSFVLP
ncbi:MAG: FecR domain-containing protein [Polyangiaceae bacterium]